MHRFPIIAAQSPTCPRNRRQRRIKPTPGAGGLPKVAVAAADGARFEVYLHGAHVTSWLPAGEIADRLFLSGSSQFAPGAAIRGGVPVCFPQFADQGPLPMHGFARVAAWELVESGRAGNGAAHVRLRLADSAGNAGAVAACVRDASSR